MKRYQHTKIEKNKFGEQVYKSTLYPHIKRHEDDIYIRTKDGDRLDNMAMTFYGDPNLWWYIAHVNHLDSMTVRVGTRLRVPTSL